MWNTKNNHLLHKKAVELVLQNLSGSVDMDSIAGYYAPYDVEWNNIKFLVKVAKRSKKESQPTAKWFYALRKKDHQIADYFVLFAILDNDNVAVYVVPKVFASKVYITITKINGNMRYKYFRTDIKNLSKKILDTQKKLPKLIKIHNQAETLRKK